MPNIYIHEAERSIDDDFVWTWHFDDWAIFDSNRGGSAITSATLTETVVSGSGSQTIGAAAISSSGLRVSVNISGGTADSVYLIKCKATNALGEDADGYCKITVHNATTLAEDL